MRKFVFIDKSEEEKNLITDLLHSENIKYSIKKECIEIPIDSDDEDCEEYIEFLPNYQIEAYTTLEMFEFIKALFKKKNAEKQLLEKCFKKKIKKKAIEK